MLVTNYDQYHGMRPKDYEDLILNSRLIKEAKFRKYKSNKTLSKDKPAFVTELS